MLSSQYKMGFPIRNHRSQFCLFSFLVTKSRRRRTEFTDSQIAKLEGIFVVNNNPTKATREQLAQCLHLQEDVINVWFKNRRAKQRRQSNATQ